MNKQSHHKYQNHCNEHDSKIKNSHNTYIKITTVWYGPPKAPLVGDVKIHKQRTPCFSSLVLLELHVDWWNAAWCCKVDLGAMSGSLYLCSRLQTHHLKEEKNVFFISSSTKLNEAHRPYDLQSIIAWRWTCQWVSCLHASYWSLNHNLDFSDCYPVFRLFDVCKHQFIKWDKSRRNTQVSNVINKKYVFIDNIYTYLSNPP